MFILSSELHTACFFFFFFPFAEFICVQHTTTLITVAPVEVNYYLAHRTEGEELNFMTGEEDPPSCGFAYVLVV